MKRAITIAITIIFLISFFSQPSAAFAQGGMTYTSGFQLQNLDETNVANVTIAFYDEAGTIVATVNDTIVPHTNKTYFPLNAVSTGFKGSVVVSSDQQLASITNVLTSDQKGGDAYAGFNQGATTIKLPLLMKNNYGISTWFNVQNIGNSLADVTVNYTGGSCTETASIPAGASHTFDQSINSCLPSGYVGGGTVTSANNIVVVVMQIVSGKPTTLAYPGFSTTSTTFLAPLISSNYYNSGTSINVQNSGSISTDVTISYTPNPGFPGNVCTETKTIPAGATVIFGFPQLPIACGTKSGTGVTDTVNGAFVGSASVINNSTDQPLTAIVNTITRGTASGSAYAAFNPATGTSKLSFPLIMDRNYGIFTGMSITNVGTQPTTVNCSFSGSTRTISQTIDPGKGFTDDAINKFTAGYVGAAFCNATGGDAKIAGIVNELVTGAPTTNDALYTYSGINY
jgi:hypothetical protein